MPCALTTGYTLDCRDSIGGIKEVYFMELSNVSGTTVASGTVTAIVKATGKRFFKYEQEINTADFTEDDKYSRENGTLYFEQKLSLVFNKYTAALMQELLLLAKNRLVALVVMKDGTNRYLGYLNGLMVSEGQYTGGKAMGDRNGKTITLMGEETSPAYFVTDALITAATTAG